MRRYWPVSLLAAILIFVVYQHDTRLSGQTDPSTPPTRIISLAPSITETMYAVGALDQLVGVTDYCVYPATVRQLPRIGGYLDPSLEHILRLKPDLVILQIRQQRLQQQLEQLGINTLMIEHSTLGGILDGIRQIGERTGRQAQASAVLADIESRIEQVQARVAGKPRRSVMLVVAHHIDSEQLYQLYLAGQHDFYNDLLTLAGGINAYQHTRLKVPSVSLEGVLRLNPDVIIDIFPEPGEHPADVTQVQRLWQTLTQLTAVQTRQVHMIEAGYAVLPGPRIINLLEDFADILHPESTTPAAHQIQAPHQD